MEALIDPNHTAEPEPESETAIFHRRIEFHVAKRPFNGFMNNNVNGFKLVTLNPNSERLNNSGLGKKPERSDLSENGLDSELGLEITFRRIGAGLRNLGNTCFLNSVLQCLTYTEPLAAYLQSGKHQSSCRTAGFCALCAIQKHVSRALQSTGRILEPKDLVSNLRCISRNFRNARQEDAHEYMVNLLETMHKCCLPSGVPSESPSAYDKSLVHKIFGGRLRSQVKCMQCSFCSNKFDPFLDLSLEIAKADSLDKALRNFTTKELLDGGEKVYQCQHCKQKVKALKQLTVYKAPSVLAVHLKRFGSHVQGQKINKKVTFAPTMDLKPFVTGPYEGDLTYTLYGVLVHAGWSTHSGHYYCFVRTSSGMWYSLDDNQVVQVSEKRVLEQKAYMLFYFRDGKKSVARKVSDVVQKENFVMNALGNAAGSKPSPDLKGKISNAAAEKRLNGSFPVVVSERSTQTSEMPEKTPLKTVSSENIHGKTGLDSSNLKVSDVNSESVSQPSKETLKVPVIDSVGHKAGSEGPRDDHLSSDVKVSNPNCSSDVVQNLKVASVVPSGCSAARDYLHDKQSSGFNSRASGNEKVVIDRSQLSDKQISTSNPSSVDMPKKDFENNKMTVGSPRKVGCLATEETLQHRPAEIVLQRMSALSDLPKNTHQLSPEILRKRKSQLKVKKKPFKRPVATPSLSSGILFGAAFFQQKKNKRRAKQQCSLRKKYCISNDGPSVSGESVPISISQFSDSQIKKENFVSVDMSRNSVEQRHNNVCAVVSDDTINKELGESVAHRSNLMPAEAQPQVRGNVSDGIGCSVDREMESRQMDVMSILTRGLDETTVARWDGIGISTLEKSEISAEGNATQIGYIGDEWDEEYDRGKRKKIRGPKIDFGGPNLFQEVASNRKRAKLDKSRYVNQPFRI